MTVGHSSFFVEGFATIHQKSIIGNVVQRNSNFILSSSARSSSSTSRGGSSSSGSGNRSSFQKRNNPQRRNASNVANRVQGNSKNQNKRVSSSSFSKLLEPSIIFSNNHILVINKPPGYHSQPNEAPTSSNSQKCMLTKLKNMKLGGGSMNDFLAPMHRLDQPCSGVILFSKTSKAGTRIGNAFRKHLVEKDYLCVVSGDLPRMKMRSEKGKGKTYEVSGSMARKSQSGKTGNGSVVFTPIRNNADNAPGEGRICHLVWEHVVSDPNDNNVHLVRCQTSTGARHQVRAMLAQLVKSPICGDLRYGAKQPLFDKSVALHARTLRLPTVKLGDLDFKNEKFVAPVPLNWSQFFSITEEMVQKKGF